MISNYFIVLCGFVYCVCDWIKGLNINILFGLREKMKQSMYHQVKII